MKPSTETLNHAIAADLYQQSWSVQPTYFDADIMQQLTAEAKQFYQLEQMTQAGIGRGATWHHEPTIRQDFIHWLNDSSAAQQQYQQYMENLRLALNVQLMLGLFALEAHYAVYEAGAFYKRHIDSFKGAANRMVSVVAYLNNDWTATAGGELLIYAENQQSVLQRIAPLAGTLVVFLSEEIPHEVAITHQQRLSIAGWFSLNQG